MDSWYADSTVPVVVWGEEVDLTADQLLKKPDGRVDMHARDEAVAFLRDLLADGPLPAKDVERHAKQAGIAWRTVERAKERAGVRSRRQRDEKGKTSVWEWFIPTIRIVPEGES